MSYPGRMAARLAHASEAALQCCPVTRVSSVSSTRTSPTSCSQLRVNSQTASASIAHLQHSSLKIYLPIAGFAG